MNLNTFRVAVSFGLIRAALRTSRHERIRNDRLTNPFKI